VKSFFVPDAGAMAAEVITAHPPIEDDGKDPCAICRPLGRCPPQCDGDGGASRVDSGTDSQIVGPGCACRVGGAPSREGVGRWSLIGALGLALASRRSRRRNKTVGSRSGTVR